MQHRLFFLIGITLVFSFPVASQIDPINMSIMKTWNLTLIRHTDVGNTFVICGTLYVIESVHELQSRISIAYDFYRQKYRDVHLAWKNLHRNSNMVSYNYFDKHIYVTDHGYLLTVTADVHWRV